MPKNETYPALDDRALHVPGAEDTARRSTLTWWDGGLMPPRPSELEPDRKMGDDDGGVLLIGDRATLMAGCYGRSPRLIPEARMKDFRPPAKTLDRVPERRGRPRAGLDSRVQGRQARRRRTSTTPARCPRWC